MTSPGTRWGLAEGRSGGPSNYQTYILLANPGPVDAEVTITYLPEGGTPFTRTYTVAANRRVNVQAGAEAGLANLNFGAIVTIYPANCDRKSDVFRHGRSDLVGGHECHGDAFALT